MWRTLRNLYTDIPAQVWLLNLVALISKCGSVVLIFLPLYLERRLGFGLIEIGNSLSMYGFGTVLGAYFGGRWSEKFGGINVQNVSLLLAGVSCLSLEFLHSIFYINLAIFLNGFFIAAVRPASAEIITQLCDPSVRPRAFALNYQAINLGCTIGPALGGIIASLDYVWIFRADALANILAAFLMVILFPRNVNLRPVKQPQSSSLLTAMRDSTFIFVLFLSLGLGLCFFQLFSMYPIFLKNVYQISEIQFGGLMALGGLLIIAFQLPLLHIFRSYNKLRLIAAGSIMIGFGFFILPLFGDYSFALSSIVIITFGEMLALPLMSEVVAKIAPKEARGTYFGIFACIFSLPMMLCPIIGTHISASLGAPFLWYGVGFLSTLVALGFASLSIRIEYRRSTIIDETRDGIA